MKPSRASGETASLAFLDVITCGFGAVILLLVIAKPGLNDVAAVETVPTRAPDVTQDVARDVARIVAGVARLRTLLESLRASAVTSDDAPDPGPAVRMAEQRLQALRGRNEGLEHVKASLKRATIQPTAPVPVPVRVPEVGGIPVDSEYVIFILDTSGSMQGIWPQVMDTVSNVLDIHPKVRGFQVLNDNGGYLISAYKRKWIPDTPGRRKSIMKVMRRWKAFSNSSPVEGLEVALRAYARQKKKVAIYVFGDDYSGTTYDQVMTTLQTFNTDRITGARSVRVHAVGFISPNTGLRYATLMREVTRTNNGAFLALPIRDARGNVGVPHPRYDTMPPAPQ